MGQKIKNSRPKKLVKSIKSISRRKFFLTKFHFLQFQKWSKINLWTGKKFKTARNAISRKKKDLFDFTSFFTRLFKIFWPAVFKGAPKKPGFQVIDPTLSTTGAMKLFPFKPHPQTVQFIAELFWLRLLSYYLYLFLKIKKCTFEISTTWCEYFNCYL